MTSAPVGNRTEYRRARAWWVVGPCLDETSSRYGVCLPAAGREGSANRRAGSQAGIGWFVIKATALWRQAVTGADAADCRHKTITTGWTEPLRLIVGVRPPRPSSYRLELSSIWKFGLE
jgi:hypothetical protein